MSCRNLSTIILPSHYPNSSEKLKSKRQLHLLRPFSCLKMSVENRRLLVAPISCLKMSVESSCSKCLLAPISCSKRFQTKFDDEDDDQFWFKLWKLIKDLSRPAAYFVVLVAATVASYHYGASRKPVKPLTPIKSSNVHNYKLQDVKYFSDVRGCDSAKAKLEVIVDMIRNAHRFMRVGAELPKGILLSGPPGTGKTLLAKAIAGEAGVPFLYRAGSEFEERLVGVGAERVRALFRDARKRAPCIVFIDEINAFGMSRKNGRGDGSTTLLQFLAEMDGVVKSESKNVLIIAATNVPSALDEALKRSGRFDMHIKIPFPDAHGREDLFELYLEGKPVEDSVSVKELARATPKFSGADIRNMINFAAVKAATEYADCISLEHLMYGRNEVTSRK